MAAVAVIPARYGSVRFPGKPLAVLQGKPVIQHVYEQAKTATCVEEVVVATDDKRIVSAVESFGGRAAITSRGALSGTDRVAEVARSGHADVIINVQGDEPLIRGEMIDQVAGFLTRHQAVPMASLMVALKNRDDAENPNVVKVVVDRDGFALYFSRASIPFIREGAGEDSSQCYKHIGLYGYQRHFLLEFPHLEPTELEKVEQLEQLRALEHGFRIKLLETKYDTIGIDTPEDLAKVEGLMAKSSGKLKVES